MEHYDAAVIGAGAAGLHCAAIAGQLGLKVLLLDHAAKVAEKIRISGGGRCNFTNRDTGPANFVSANPHFCRSALARYTPADFIALIGRHGIAWHEKHRGQLFCDRSAEDIIAMLLRECEAGGVTRRQPCGVAAVRRVAGGFELDTEAGPVSATRLVIATGGLSIPKIGASDFGYRIASQFGHTIVETAPAEKLCSDPLHPYTQALLRSVPDLAMDRSRRLAEIAGQPPSSAWDRTGCAFEPRCPRREEICRRVAPVTTAAGADREIACHVASRELAS